jgi:uncharacterized protein (TIGR03437 family)
LFAPDAIVSAFGSGLATGTAAATTNPPLTTLGGATVTVTDSSGNTQPSELLYVSPVQVNYIVPDGLAAGAATVAFNSGGGTQTQTIQLGPVAPGMFTFNAAGLVAGSVLRVSGDGTQTAENFYQLDGSGAVVPVAIDLGPATDQVFLILYGTGFRAAGTAGTSMTIGGQNAQVSFAGPQGAFAGLDQVNVLVPRSLAGSGSVSIVLTASRQNANTVKYIGAVEFSRAYERGWDVKNGIQLLTCLLFAVSAVGQTPTFSQIYNFPFTETNSATGAGYWPQGYSPQRETGGRHEYRRRRQ